MESASLVADTARRILAQACDPGTINRAADENWRPAAWSALEDAGLTLAWVPESAGGAGAGLADGFAVLRECGRAAAPLPIAETLLAGWLLSEAGLSVPKGAMTCAPARDGAPLTLAGDGTLSGRLRGVPFATEARHLAVVAERGAGGAAVALIDAGAVRLAGGTSLAGESLDTVTFERARPVAVQAAPPALGVESLHLMGAAARAMQIAGALEAILEIAVSYANERVAFGRPIAKFQAVQHNLARLAGEVSAAMAAAGSAAEAIATASAPLWSGAAGGASPDERRSNEAIFLEVASAKIRVGEAAGEGAAIAHQVLGAIGFTKEHVLHRFTRRLWAWRDDFGNESIWAAKLGRRVAAEGADGLWPLLAAR